MEKKPRKMMKKSKRKTTWGGIVSGLRSWFKREKRPDRWDEMSPKERRDYRFQNRDNEEGRWQRVIWMRPSALIEEFADDQGVALPGNWDEMSRQEHYDFWKEKGLMLPGEEMMDDDDYDYYDDEEDEDEDEDEEDEE